MTDVDEVVVTDPIALNRSLRDDIYGTHSSEGLADGIDSKAVFRSRQTQKICVCNLCALCAGCHHGFSAQFWAQYIPMHLLRELGVDAEALQRYSEVGWKLHARSQKFRFASAPIAVGAFSFIPPVKTGVTTIISPTLPFLARDIPFLVVDDSAALYLGVFRHLAVRHNTPGCRS